MRVGELMTHNPKTCKMDDTIQSVARVMAEGNFGFMPVVDNEGRLIGTVTDRDIVVRATAAGMDQMTPVREVFSDMPVHVSENDPLSKAEELMMDAHIRRLVVIDDGKRPIGVVSASDITRHETDAERLRDLFCTVLEPIPYERTVGELVGSESCG